MVNYNDIIFQIASRELYQVLKEHKTKGGTNGPYNDKETDLRNSAHWIQIFSYMFKTTGNNMFLEALRILADRIVSSQNANGSFECRNKTGKDRTNGVIGVAWIIEGLIEAAMVLKEDRYYECACDAFFSHNFISNKRMWEIKEIDNSLLGIDNTYNHQLWYAASGAIINGYKRNNIIDNTVRSFMEGSLDSFSVHSDGLICHFADTNNSIKDIAKSVIGHLKQYLSFVVGKPNMRYKESGYHYFVMYGFAILHHYYADNMLFKSFKFKRALAYTANPRNAIKLVKNDSKSDGTGLAAKVVSDCNIYGFPYNSPAFELPFIINEFNLEFDKAMLEEIKELQINLTYDIDKCSFSRNTEDELTLNARIYEYLKYQL